ncbi:hypothetical protein [Methylobacterium sp. AMS5]|uniref:hypothetical protein n=1 Tax=Methylobacterium sp. AMS5 TaxID=925818 RepID=UPI00074F81D0|nr:hypothetical protein [Methylobacterium sp. AMS5]AMB46911.1 hypothetical protein Y590_18395 [Methylobacterium sp. AMS5]
MAARYGEAFHLTSHLIMVKNAHSYHHKKPAPPTRYPDRRAAIQGLASIHDGIKGRSIPREVMDFYKVLKNGDRFRPRMLREVVLGLETALINGVSDRQHLHATVLGRLETTVRKWPVGHLKEWLQADCRRLDRLPSTSNNRLDALREGWLGEAAEMIGDTLDYADALVRDTWEAASAATSKGVPVGP